MNLESTRLVANCEVALGHSALQGLKIRWVSSQSALIAEGPSEVKVRISGQADMIAPAPCLVFSTPHSRPVLGEKEESMVSFGPDTSCSCTVISGPMVSSVSHVSVKVKLDSVCGFQAAVHFGGPCVG